MNKNPERPENMNDIMSSVFNKGYLTEEQKYKRQQEELLKSIFQ